MKSFSCEKSVKLAYENEKHGSVLLKAFWVSVLAGSISFSATVASASEFVSVSERLEDNTLASAVNNVVFENISPDALQGGAVFNSIYNKELNINADFKNNSVVSEDLNTYGGALFNGSRGGIVDAPLELLSLGDFESGADVAPVLSSPVLGNITGNFTQNTAQGMSAYGGAVFNEGEIGDIKGNFEKNTVSGHEAYGGAISNGQYERSNGMLAQANQSNQGVLELLSLNTGDTEPSDEPNTDSNIDTYSAVNAEIVTSKINSITGKFSENAALGEKVYGGAIFNSGAGKYSTGYSGSNILSQAGQSILGLDGSDYNTSTSTSTNELKEYVNIAIIDSIDAEFTGNYAQGGYSYGGAIFNGKLSSSRLSILAMKVQHNISAIPANTNSVYSIINSISGNFTNNFVQGGFGANGGAIYNSDFIGTVDADFTQNFAEGEAALGGAIFNTGSRVENVEFGLLASENDNSRMVVEHHLQAVPAGGTINRITGSFDGNYAASENGIAQGGAIFNGGKIGLVVTEQDAVSVYLGGIVNSLFTRNHAISENYIAYGGAIFNEGNIGITIIDTENPDAAPVCAGGIVNSSFIGNYAVSENDTAKGGAIYTTTNLFITAKDGYTSVFQGNYTESKGVRDDNAIYVGAVENVDLSQSNEGVLGLLGSYEDTDSSTEKLSSGYKINRSGDNLPTLVFRMENGGKILMKDNIDGDMKQSEPASPSEPTLPPDRDTDMPEESPNYSSGNMLAQAGQSMLLSSSDNTGAADENNEAAEDTLSSGYKIDRAGDDAAGLAVSEKNPQAQVTYSYKVNIIGDDINNTTFYLLNDIRNASVGFANTTINTVNNLTHVYNFGKLTIDADTNFVADVDLANKEMDRFTADGYGEHKGNLNVVGMNLLSDAVDGAEKTAVYFAQPGLKNNVTNAMGELPDNNYQTVVYTPIYKYNVTYDAENEYDGKGDGGYFIFTRGGGNGGIDDFNPSVLSAPVSSVSASQATINETFKYVFEHADAFSKMPSMDRMTLLNSNKYASTDFNDNLCHLCDEVNNKAAWVRPYATFETMNVSHGPKVDAITYGSLVGFDTDFREHKNGWHSVDTAYIGYNGNQLRYNGVHTSMNGGLLGYTHTMYKGNFWSALTLSSGASVGESQTMYGKEDFTTLMAGFGSKTGYNFEFSEGKYIIQPIMFMSYTFVNTFDYTNSAGVRIKPSPAHSIQLNPTVRFIANTKNGWQPYVSAGFVWNAMNESKVMANSVRLPEMNMKPYVEYGVGLQRSVNDSFTAFGQAMIRNGGRNGIALTFGLRWALGHKGYKRIEKVHNGSNAQKRTVLKQPSLT